jgi:hypothetical protein
MKPRITLLAIGVDNLERSLSFYRDGLGLPTKGVVGTEFEHGAVAFFELSGGLKFPLYPRNDIAHEAKVPQRPRSSTEFVIAHNVRSKEEVDSVIAEAGRAGAVVTDPPRTTFYGGYPDGHLWEIAWNPQMMPEGWAVAVQCSAFIATSLDGLIARPDDRIDWLPTASERATTTGTGTSLPRSTFWSWARRPYESAKSFSQWPYGKRRVYVSSSDYPSAGETAPRSRSPRRLCQEGDAEDDVVAEIIRIYNTQVERTRSSPRQTRSSARGKLSGTPRTRGTVRQPPWALVSRACADWVATS